MTRARLAMLILVSVLTLAGLAVAGTPEESAVEPEATAVADEFTTEESLARIQLEYTLWVDAVLSGSESESERLEKSLIGLVNHDNMVNQQEVRNQAKSVVLEVGAEGDESDDALALKQAISRLNIKEALYRSIVKSDAFSNKYRLLGDYIDLLRRELKMPRLKLALDSKSGRASPGESSPPAPSKQ